MAEINAKAYKEGLVISEIRSVPLSVAEKWEKTIALPPYEADQLEYHSADKPFKSYASLSSLVEDYS